MSALIYLDNASTTRVHPEVAAAMAPFLAGAYGNPSSLHAAGREVRKAVEDARDAVAICLNASPKEIVFTSGGTEADNLAVFGAARAPREKGTHVVTSAVEHPAVLHAARALEAEGARVTFVGVDAEGRVSPDDVERALRPDTVLVSVMLVNNEVGTVQAVAEIARRVRARGVAVHTDAVQALGKMPLDARALGVDLLSVSAHKIHGPKGVGALVAREGAKLRAVQIGGPQEWGRRPGTENVAGIVGFAAAMERVHRDLTGRVERMRALRDRLERALLSGIDRVRVNGRNAERAANILNVTFEGAEGESILIGLDALGVCVSTGSACSSGSTEPSHVLTAMGLALEQAQGSIRFSLSEETTAAEVDAAADAAARVVAKLRAISPLYEPGPIRTPGSGS